VIAGPPVGEPARQQMKEREMPQFRKKPVVVEACRYNGSNALAIMAWAQLEETSEDFTAAWRSARRKGTMRADVGDWVIRGVKGEFYPCKPDIFEEIYEPV
jgi:hypothetical protein